MRKIIREGYTIRIMPPKECNYEGYSLKFTYKYDKDEKKYLISMWLNRNDIDDNFRIDSQEIDIQYISGTKDTIEDNINRIADYMYLTGRIDPYIKRFEYTYKCFDQGDNFYEKERLKSL